MINPNQPTEAELHALEKARDLENLYRRLMPIAASEVAKILSKYQMIVSTQRRAEFSHDTASRMIERYLKDPNFTVFSFRECIRHRAMEVVLDQKEARRAKKFGRMISLDVLVNLEYPVHQEDV